MGLYGEQVLPRLINVACAMGPVVGPLRERVCAGLHGEVVEIGFGSGHNVPHYPAAVTRVLPSNRRTSGGSWPPTGSPPARCPCTRGS